MKIGDIYQLSKGNEQNNYPLDEWYNTLINKDINEIDVFDLCKMIRQNILIDLAVNQSTEILRINPLEGDVYDGQLIELLYSIDYKEIKEHTLSLQEILQKIKQTIEIDDFMCEEDYNEYMDLVDKFIVKLNCK
ncbi:hypothetical protein HXA34_11815 [Salipaludibacillus agaradhaerens]|uniref:contact-dependent growth inhibition system immunity protein n=1 Tax=Salipaludibacillus agaradhaerens TaxID=76935 RepID=UPI0021515AA8|nr:contact-dependent growth inhibition system immunity protein [Salipaludibacillus agaradhaerens]MCR6106976.1 hypothetical protein [Salipaludibacillus agaradhaerens]MCR6119008.1 hypothetical protein [Salipaludibacillus agaradhaerens]UJW58064.1 hypothetical protein HXZ66_11940 [Bacillus sp. A116_S68]